MEGYEGLACARMKCPERCNNHGMCVTMRQFAAKLDKGLQPRPYFTYANNWDAEMIHGCACDNGYSGWDCTERVCPAGDDPMTITQADEVQLLRCDLDGTSNTNAFTLSYRGAVTQPFAPSASALQLKSLLEALPTIGQVTVVFGRGFTFCSREYSPLAPPSGNVVSITFVTEHGDVPSLVVLDAKADPLTGIADNSVAVAVDGQSLSYSSPLGTSTATSVQGQKELLPCNGRGTCDRFTGDCRCYPGYASSDSLGRVGQRGDCGFVTMPITACPGYPECSGHGVCSGDPSYTCSCFDGWGGGDCSERQCPQGAAWFDYPSADGIAHGTAECSNKGRCNRATGQCECQNLFEGEACERMTCPGTTTIGANKQVCSGRGRCLTMLELAAHATVNGDATPYTYGADPNNAATWDGRQVYGCLCDKGFAGYDCSQRTCASGEDITLLEWDATRTNEVQTLACALLSNAGGPYFKLRFRQAETRALLPSTTAAELEAALEALDTIGDIAVSYGTGGAVAACSASPGTTITFSFRTEHGDLPPLQVAMDEGSVGLDGTYAAGEGWGDTTLEFTGGNPANDYRSALTYIKTPSAGYAAMGVRSLESRKGTSGNEECSGRGRCDRDTGVCKCYPGFGPSDGQRGPGSVEDCGWREPFQTVDGDWQNIYAS